MKKILALACLLAASGLLQATASAREIRVEPGQTRSSAINAFRSRLFIGGKVDESVFLMGGQLRLEGEITGDVICLGSRVEIGDAAVIGRDLIVIGGSLAKAERARIGGQLYHVRTQRDLKKIASSMLPFLPEGGGRNFFKIIKIFLWLFLALLTLLIMPGPVERAAVLLAERPLRHLWRGLAAELAFALLLLSFLLMSLVLIGIPLLFLLLAAYFLLLIFGRTTVLYFAGSRLAAALKLKGGGALFVILGIALYALFKFLPFPFGLLLVVMDFFAIGIGVSFFLRRRKSAA